MQFTLTAAILASTAVTALALPAPNDDFAVVKRMDRIPKEKAQKLAPKAMDRYHKDKKQTGQIGVGAAVEMQNRHGQTKHFTGSSMSGPSHGEINAMNEGRAQGYEKPVASTAFGNNGNYDKSAKNEKFVQPCGKLCANEIHDHGGTSAGRKTNNELNKQFQTGRYSRQRRDEIPDADILMSRELNAVLSKYGH